MVKAASGVRVAKVTEVIITIVGAEKSERNAGNH